MQTQESDIKDIGQAGEKTNMRLLFAKRRGEQEAIYKDKNTRYERRCSLSFFGGWIE
jgi:hypothetical protein